MFPLDLLQELATFLAVFSPLVQHFQQEAASSKSLLLPLSQLMDVKSSSGLAQWSTSCSPLTAVLLTLAGGAEVVSLPSLGLFLFPTLLLERDPAVVDQIMMVHQVEVAARWTD